MEISKYPLIVHCALYLNLVIEACFARAPLITTISLIAQATCDDVIKWVVSQTCMCLHDSKVLKVAVNVKPQTTAKILPCGIHNNAHRLKRQCVSPLFPTYFSSVLPIPKSHLASFSDFS